LKRKKKTAGAVGSGRPDLSLQELAGWLNDAPTLSGKLGVAWRAAADILAPLVPAPSRDRGPVQFPTLLDSTHEPWRIRRHDVFPALAVRKFNALAREAPVRLALVAERAKGGGGRIAATIRADDLLPIVLRQLWETVFLERQLDRLKRCDRCARWFVDRGDNRRARFCGRECEQRWWTRPRRRLVKEGRKTARERRRGGSS
jgi:hypothetical protein